MFSHLTKHDGQKYWCKKCLHGFSREDLLSNHDEDCVKPQKTVYPEKDSTKSFKNHQKQMRVPFTIYADFESWSEKPENLTLYSDEELKKSFEGLISQSRLPKDMLIKKGVFPYSWVDKPSKLGYPSLPPIKDFYDNLSNESCCKEDYEHEQEVWKHFKCKTFNDYHDLYLKTNVFTTSRCV